MHFNGLTDKQVEESRKKYGSNVIPDSEPTTFWAEFKETFKDPMIRILLAIAALMIVMCVLGYAEIYEPIGTVVAVLIVAFVSAKEAGKIVILDDNFKSIKDAIWYGRTIYHNILKFCRFQLVINVAAVVVSAIAPFFGVEEPLKVTHLLFVNLVMDGLGAIMLGNEPAQERYMSEPPRRRDESIVSKSMMAQIVTMGLWLTALSFVFLKVPFFDSFFASTEQKLSAYFVLFIWSALFNAFNVRSDSFDIFKDLKLNPGFMRVFVIIVLVQAFIVNAALIPVPVFGWISNMFSCVPFPPAGWAAAILLAFTMIPVDILRKVIVGRK